MPPKKKKPAKQVQNQEEPKPKIVINKKETTKQHKSPRIRPKNQKPVLNKIAARNSKPFTLTIKS